MLRSAGRPRGLDKWDGNGVINRPTTAGTTKSAGPLHRV